jgi:hypothetical protein
MTDQLHNRDYTLIIDRSGSMGSSDVKGFASRWEAAREATMGLANKVSQFDADGITLYTFSNNFKKYEHVGPQAVDKVWQENEPNGSTNLDGVIHDALYGPTGYFTRKAAGKTKTNGETILVITDGQPDNAAAVSQAIIGATKKMERDEELSFTFVQVGGDQGATRFLKDLDDHLQSQGAKFDIVDTLTVEQMGERSLTDVLVSSIND